MKKLSLLLVLILAVAISVTAFGCGPIEEVTPAPVERKDAGTVGYLFTEYEGFYYEDASRTHNYRDNTLYRWWLARWDVSWYRQRVWRFKSKWQCMELG
jgi:hypothetical protein